MLKETEGSLTVVPLDQCVETLPATSKKDLTLRDVPKRQIIIFPHPGPGPHFKRMILLGNADEILTATEDDVMVEGDKFPILGFVDKDGKTEVVYDWLHNRGRYESDEQLTDDMNAVLKINGFPKIPYPKAGNI